MSISIWVNNEQHQASTLTNVDLSSKLFCGISQRGILQYVFMNLIHDMRFGDHTFEITVTSPMG